MGLEDYITVQLKIGTRLKTIKMEKGTSFKNNSGIFTASENDNTLKVTNYQFQFIKAVANNYTEDGEDDAIILSKKDIDIAIKKYKAGGLKNDLEEFLGNSGYTIQNPKVFSKENKISAYVTNGTKSKSAVLSFQYDTKEKGESTLKNVEKTNGQGYQNKYRDKNVIIHRPFNHIVKSGESIVSLAQKYKIDTYQIIAANPQLKEGTDYEIRYRKGNTAILNSNLRTGQIIKIPERYSVKENSVRNFDDLCKITGLSLGYIEDLLTVIEVSPKHPGKPDLTTYDDGYGMPTIGYGHTGSVDGKPLSIKNKITISNNKALQLLAEDLLKHEAMVISYLGKENYQKAPPSVKAAILDVAYNKGIWDGFLNPNHNASTAKIKTNLKDRHYASALCNTTRRNTANRGLKRRNIYRFISGLTDLTPSKREAAMKNMHDYYQSVISSLRGAEAQYLKQAWQNAKLGKTTGYRIQCSQTDRS